MQCKQKPTQRAKTTTTKNKNTTDKQQKTTKKQTHNRPSQITPSKEGVREGLRLIHAVALPLQRDIAIFGKGDAWIQQEDAESLTQKTTNGGDRVGSCVTQTAKGLYGA